MFSFALLQKTINLLTLIYKENIMMKKELKITPPPLSPLSLLAAKASLACAALSVVLLIVLHVLRPDIDPTWRFISEYALGDYG